MRFNLKYNTNKWIVTITKGHIVHTVECDTSLEAFDLINRLSK